MIIEEEPNPQRIDGRVQIDMRANLFGRMRANVESWKAKVYDAYVGTTNFVDRFVPSKFSTRSAEDQRLPGWALSIEHWVIRNKSPIKWFFVALMVTFSLSILSPVFTMVSDVYNDNDMVIDLKLISPEKAERYIEYNKEVNALVKGKQKCRNGDPNCYVETIINHLVSEYDEEDEEGEEKVTHEKTSLYDPRVLEICGTVEEFQSFWATPKVFCYDVLEYMLNSRYNKPQKKKKAQRDEPREFNCICSDYFGLDIKFTYMGYVGDKASLLVAPKILPQEKSKKSDTFSMAMEQAGEIGQTHEALARATNTLGPIAQHSTVRASYYTTPSADQLQAAYPWAANVTVGVNNLKFRDLYGVSTGVKIFDWLLSTIRVFDSWINPDRKDQYAVNTFMEERIKKAPAEKQRQKGFMDWSIKTSYDKSKPKSLVHVKEAEFPVPYGTCLLHCERLRDSVTKA